MPSDKQILLGLTTTKHSDWRDKTEEIRQFHLTEVALLPTAINVAERKELYRLLESAGLESIPYVHLRHDFTVEEIDYLVTRFKTKTFSCHPDKEGYALLDKLPKYNSMIFMENFGDEGRDKLFDQATFDKHQVSGICLDLAHLEEAKKTDKRYYKKVLALTDKHPIKVNHISGVKSSVVYKFFNKTYVDHSLDSLSDLSYLKDVSEHHFAPLIVLELENSFMEQLEIKKFVEHFVK